MPKPKYLFINKDAASDCLSRSSGLQKSAIQKHVQRGVMQSGRPCVQKLKTDSGRQVFEVDDEALYNPSVRSLSCKLDAFNGSSIFIDGTIRALIDYYVYNYHPAIWNFQPLALPLQPYALQRSSVQNLRKALQDPLVMYCLLSAAASRANNVDRLSFPGSPTTQDYFMQEALCLMQGRIQETDTKVAGSTDPLVLCMMFLCSAEAYRHNHAAAWTHLKVALKLLEPKGGVMMVPDENLQGQLVMSDLALSCINLKPCLCPYEFYDPGPSFMLGLTDEERSQVDNNTLGSRLLKEGPDILPLKLRNLVAAILDSYAVKFGLQTEDMSTSRYFEIRAWAQKRTMAIRNRLLAFKTSDDKMHALRAALIMWTLLSMTITGRILTVKLMATKLRLILANIPMQAWKGSNNRDIGLWILLVGHSCANEASETYTWYSEQIRRMIMLNYKASGKWSGVHGLLEWLIEFHRGFLYHDPVQRSRLEELVEWLSSWGDVAPS